MELNLTDLPDELIDFIMENTKHDKNKSEENLNLLCDAKALKNFADGKPVYSIGIDFKSAPEKCFKILKHCKTECSTFPFGMETFETKEDAQKFLDKVTPEMQASLFNACTQMDKPQIDEQALMATLVNALKLKRSPACHEDLLKFAQNQISISEPEFCMMIDKYGAKYGIKMFHVRGDDVYYRV